MPDDRQSTHTMAVFCDFENIALGTREARYSKFDIQRVLERLLLKGNIVVKKAYCDWDRYRDFKKPMHEAAFEMIEIPHLRMSGKNSADIRMVVDALDLCYTKEHVNCFVIVSGDSDFSPLVSKLRENNKIVIGLGVKQSTSDLFITNCDEFIFYDDLVRQDTTSKRRRRKVSGETSATTGGSGGGNQKDKSAPADGDNAAQNDTSPGAPEGDPAKAIELVLETIEALMDERNEDEPVWGSMVKQTLKRRHPGFSERYHGFRSFSDLLQEARKRGLLELERDEKSGGYKITALKD